MMKESSIVARDLEALLEQELIEDQVCVNASVKDDSEALLTASLIEEVFMSEHLAIRGHEADMRLKELQKRMNLLYRCLESYLRDKSDVFAKKALSILLRPDAPFSGFTRCYVRKHLSRHPDLAPLITHNEI